MKKKILSWGNILMLTLSFWAGTAAAREMPFGLSNPYDEKDVTAKNALPAILKDLGLSDDGHGAGFVIDIIGRKNAEINCDDAACRTYDFSQAKELIDLVVGQGKTNLWIVIGSPSNCKFIDGKKRKDQKTYLPDGPISRQAYKDYLTALVNFVNSYGRQISGNADWHVIRWNLYNEVNAEYRETFDRNVDRAATTYANFVVDSAEVLRRLSPQSKIVLAGASSATDLSGNHGEFYKLVFSKLKQVFLAYEPFDYWESHWFGAYKNYGKNEAGYGVKDFINFLNENGYGDKEFLIRAGATYSGQDTQERKDLMNNYQSEEDQAEFLIKRFIYNLAAGARRIPWSTGYEHKKYHGGLHVHFNYVGLIYNGVPDGISKKQKCAEGWRLCPDPGEGVKKLSYFAFKHLIKKLKGSDFENIQTLKDGKINNLYLYKLLKDGKPIYLAWWDYFNEDGHKEGDTKEMTINNIAASAVEITEAIPKYAFGYEVADYNTAFNSYTTEVTNGNVTVKLGKNPVFIEIADSAHN